MSRPSRWAISGTGRIDMANLEELQQSRNDALARLAELRPECEAIPREIQELKSSLVASSADPGRILAAIKQKEDRLQILELQVAQVEGDRIRADVGLARWPIDSYKLELAAAIERESAALATLQQAQLAFEEITQNVVILKHRIVDSENAVQ